MVIHRSLNTVAGGLVVAGSHCADAKAANSCHHSCHDETCNQGFDHGETRRLRGAFRISSKLDGWMFHGFRLTSLMEFIGSFFLAPPLIGKNSLKVNDLVEMSCAIDRFKMFFRDC